MNKLTYEDQIDICMDYIRDKDSSHESLAKEYCLSDTTIGNVLKSFGIEDRHTVRKNLEHEDKIDICADYLWDDESTPKLLGKEYGVSKLTITTVLVEFKIKNRPKTKELTYEDRIDICADYLWDDKSTYASLAKEYKVSTETILRVLIRFGINQKNYKVKSLAS